VQDKVSPEATAVAVVYERVSSDGQDIARQAVQRERAQADDPEREVVVIPDDGVSAYRIPIFDRPGGKRLCALIESGRVEALYTDAQDRLSRGKQSEWWNFADLCEQFGTRIFIDGRELRLDDEGDEIRSALDAILARRESREKSHRTRSGLREAARQGRQPCGQPPRWVTRWSASGASGAGSSTRARRQSSARFSRST
jgi:DNA invertase Pin-like site-specific DNA recombinase